MKREILFRGRKLKGTEWFEGDLSRVVQNDGRCYVFPSDGYNSPDWYEVDPDTVGQYTGLTDKNGKKIFEGDIIRTDKYGKDCGHVNVNGVDTFTVQYEPCMFRLVNKYRGFNLVDNGFSKFEVVGNVHDNPELLKGGGWND